ncbi:hypothetical protein CYMTET_18002, partial [Cymbomonas tetramitiformis]
AVSPTGSTSPPTAARCPTLATACCLSWKASRAWPGGAARWRCLGWRCTRSGALRGSLPCADRGIPRHRWCFGRRHARCRGAADIQLCPRRTIGDRRGI